MNEIPEHRNGSGSAPERSAQTAGAGTPDLLLRPWVEDDATALREAIDEDPGHLRPWLSWTLEEPASLERTRARLTEHIEQFRSGRALRYAVTPAARPSMILGGANLYADERPETRGVGYWVRASASRKGIAGSAVAALIQEAFRSAEVDRVVLQCDVANTASVTFAQRLGFRRTGESIRSFPDGSPRPVLELDMTRHRYLTEWSAAVSERAGRVRIAV